MARTVSVGLIGGAEDRGLALLACALQERGAAVARIALTAETPPADVAVDVHGIAVQGVRLDALDVFYVRRGEYMTPVPEWLPTPEEWPALRRTLDQALRRAQEPRSIRASMLRLLAARRPVVNHPDVHRACRLMPSALRLMAACDVPVAPFVSGNDLKRLAYFVDAHAERCRVRRPCAAAWTEEVCDFAYLAAHHEVCDHAPLLVRRHMGGDMVHVFVAGGACGAVLARSEGRWRAAPAPDDTAVEVAVHAAAAVGAAMALVSLERDAHGRAFVVGLDAEPDLAALQDEGGAPVCAFAAELLCRVAGRDADAGLPAALRACAPSARSDGGLRPPRRSPRIGIVGTGDNAEVAAVSRALEERGAVSALVEMPLFPDRRALHEQQDGGVIGTTDLAALDGVFLRTTGIRTYVPDPPGVAAEDWRECHARFRTLVADETECFPFRYAVLETLARRIPVINAPYTQEVHRTKLWQLCTLARAGLPVPPTAAAGALDRCRAFVAAHGGPDRVVIKPAAGVYKTRLVSAVDLEEACAAGPAILQRIIEGDTVRAYLVGGRLVGAGVIRHGGDAIDSSVDQEGVDPVELPAPVVEAGAKAAALLGLAWTGMDFMRERSTGRYFILECNAAAMFTGFAYRTGCDVAGALADLLIGLARGC